MPTRLRMAWLVACVSMLWAWTALASPALPPILARYAVFRGQVETEHFELVRTTDRVEHRFLDRGVVEIWQREGRDGFEHWKLFTREQKAVHYHAGDLRTLRLSPSWEELASLVDGADRAKRSERPGRRRVHGEPVRDLRGPSGNHIERLLWLERSALPAEMSRGRGRNEVTFRLRSLEACAEGCVETDLTGIEEIEFADLGDRERDPFVRRFLAYTSQAHAH